MVFIKEKGHCHKILLLGYRNVQALKVNQIQTSCHIRSSIIYMPKFLHL